MNDKDLLNGLFYRLKEIKTAEGILHISELRPNGKDFLTFYSEVTSHKTHNKLPRRKQRGIRRASVVDLHVIADILSPDFLHNFLSQFHSHACQLCQHNTRLSRTLLPIVVSSRGDNA